MSGRKRNGKLLGDTTDNFVIGHMLETQISTKGVSERIKKKNENRLLEKSFKEHFSGFCLGFVDWYKKEGESRYCSMENHPN